ncbi:MAG: hypothetical protein ACRCTJ_02625, partial [Brevinema sp.]
WLGDYKETFFMYGVIKTIQSREQSTVQIIPKQEVKDSFYFLKNLEKSRNEYPISKSPTEAPSTKRPIVMIAFESFYDYRDLYPLFGDKNPFPKEYLELVNTNTYTGPNQNDGSFLARLILLTGSYPLEFLDTTRSHPYTLPYELKKYGYTTYTLESVTPTYNLDKHYKNWFIDHEEYCVFGNDWSGSRLDPYRFEKGVVERIHSTPNNITPFYFIFTFLGHVGSTQFTDKIDDTEHLDEFLKYFNSKKEKLNAKRLLKASVFNARRLVFFKNEILKKYPNALIVFKTDHFSHETKYNIKNSQLPEEYKNLVAKNPASLPILMIDGINGLVDLPKGISPDNIPLTILVKAGLPYKNTLLSLMYQENDPKIINIYGRIFDKKTNLPLPETHPKYLKLIQRNKAAEKISIDLYKGNSYTTNYLQ